MPIIKHVTLQKIVAHDFRYVPRISRVFLLCKFCYFCYILLITKGERNILKTMEIGRLTGLFTYIMEAAF